MVQRTFIADLANHLARMKASVPPSQVCIEAFIEAEARIPGLISLHVRDGSIAPPLVLRVTPQCNGYEKMSARPPILGLKVRACGTLTQSFPALRPTRNSLVLICDELHVIEPTNH